MRGSIASTRPTARAAQSSRPPLGPCAARFFDLARINQAPIASEAVTRIDALFAIEREINGLAPPQRVGVRTERSRPLVGALETWFREQRAKSPRAVILARPSTTASSAGSRSLASSMMAACACPIMRPRASFAPSRSGAATGPSPGLTGARRPAALYTLIATAKLNDVDPQAWLSDVLARVLDYPAKADRRPPTLELACRTPCCR